MKISQVYNFKESNGNKFTCKSCPQNFSSHIEIKRPDGVNKSIIPVDKNSLATPLAPDKTTKYIKGGLVFIAGVALSGLIFYITKSVKALSINKYLRIEKSSRKYFDNCKKTLNGTPSLTSMAVSDKFKTQILHRDYLVELEQSLNEGKNIKSSKLGEMKKNFDHFCAKINIPNESDCSTEINEIYKNARDSVDMLADKINYRMNLFRAQLSDIVPCDIGTTEDKIVGLEREILDQGMGLVAHSTKINNRLFENREFDKEYINKMMLSIKNLRKSVSDKFTQLAA